MGVIATMLIGNKYKSLWESTAKASWLAYAKKNHIDVVVIEDLPPGYIDEKPFAWNKLLIGRHPALPKTGKIAWLDSDIIINHEIAENIFEHAETGKISLCEGNTLIRHPFFSRSHHHMGGGRDHNQLVHAIYRAHGISENVPKFLANTGVFVFDENVKYIMESTYYKYKHPGGSQQQEQAWFSYEVIANDALHVLDPKFNVLWYEYVEAVFGKILSMFPGLLPATIAQAIFNSYFLHFAGRHQDMIPLSSEVEFKDDRIVVSEKFMELIKIFEVHYGAAD